jgi:hypothetical protein
MTDGWLQRNIRIEEYDGWAFLKADKNFGSWKPQGGSPNTLEEYEITIHGTWVPAVDAGWLLSFRKKCPCNADRLTWMFAQLRPTRRQMEARPKKPPRPRAESLSKFGLIHVTGG